MQIENIDTTTREFRGADDGYGHEIYDGWVAPRLYGANTKWHLDSKSRWPWAMYAGLLFGAWWSQQHGPLPPSIEVRSDNNGQRIEFRVGDTYYTREIYSFRARRTSIFS